MITLAFHLDCIEVNFTSTHTLCTLIGASMRSTSKRKGFCYLNVLVAEKIMAEFIFWKHYFISGMINSKISIYIL